jgi:16S rRNA (cytidine1402-2'-O)-methyltransferase
MTDKTLGQLVIVATPLGNLGDLSPRALQLLASADAVFCEDTRHSRTLFSANNISPSGRLFALHEHNEAEQSGEVITRIARGETVVLISDAGTPGISDPGTRVVAAVAAAGQVVTTAPGPSAVIAALSVAGIDTERFVMEGFVPRKAGERLARYGEWAKEHRTIVFYESPQRLQATLTELAQHFANRQVCVARELTKLHEELIRGSVAEVANLVAGREILGEIVVVLAGAGAAPPVEDEVVVACLRDRLNSGDSTKDAATYAAELYGVSQRVAYELALAIRNTL